MQTSKEATYFGESMKNIFSATNCLLLAILIVVILMFHGMHQDQAAIYNCPESCYGVTKVEGYNAFEFINLKTGVVLEKRFCPSPRVNLFVGYVITELHEVERECDFIGREDLYYKILRGKDIKQFPYAELVKYDGDDRPVLLNNCFNTSDDTNTYCTGEYHNAKSSR